jgi:hypothetical protein
MAIDINGTVLKNNNSSFQVEYNSRIELSLNSNGQIKEGPLVPLATAYSNTASWNVIGTSGTWAVPTLFSSVERLQTPSGPVSANLSYSPLRYTVSKTGIYLVSFHLYSRDSSSTAYPTGGYVHPQIGVNGSPSGRRPGGNPYRIRHHGLQGGYDSDTEVSEFLSLIQGDYIEPMHYCNGNQQYYPQHSSFAVYFIG